MCASLNTAQSTKKKGWTYATLTVMDGVRQLRPREVGGDQIYFTDPPHLVSEQVEVIITVGDEEQRQMVTVLPHDAEATQIPIQFVRQ